MNELGIYYNFPTFAHLDIRFSTRVHQREAVAAIVHGLARLNSLEDQVETSVAGRSGTFSAARAFEVGMAEGSYFNYLDELEVERVSKLSTPPSTVDFIVYVKYKYMKRGKAANLLSDSYLVRMSLDPSSIKVFQMGGLRRTEPENLVELIIRTVNSEAKLLGQEKDILVTEEPNES